MAVRFDAEEPYTSTSSPPVNSYTVLCWVMISTDRNTWSCMWSTDAGTGAYHYLETDSDGTTLTAWHSNGQTINGSSMTVGTWYRVAFVVSGTTATLYMGTATGALSTFSGGTWTAITPTTLRIGASPFSDEWWNGRVASFKHYSVALTVAELEREFSQYVPVSTSNLVRFHPFIANETTDYSGNARTLSGGSGTSREDGPPIPWRAVAPRTVLPSAAAGNPPITLGQAIETSTATAVTRSKTRAIGQASETDTAAAVSRSKSRTLGQASETETATALSRTKSRGIGQAAEADTASALARSKSRVIGQATESNSAQSLSRAKNRAIGQAQETDTAQPLTVAGSNMIVLGLAVETSTATALTRSKRLAIGQASSLDTATALTRSKSVTIGQPSETATATALTRSKTLALRQASETDTAQPLVLLGQEPPEEAFTAGRVSTGWAAGEIATGWTPGGTNTGWQAGQLT